MNINTGNTYRGIGSLLLLPWKEMEIIYEQGYTDAVNFLRKEGSTTDKLYNFIYHVTMILTFMWFNV